MALRSCTISSCSFYQIGLAGGIASTFTRRLWLWQGLNLVAYISPKVSEAKHCLR